MFFGKKKMATGNVDYIIVGLGNPGGEYEATRHNAGFVVIDMLAEECSCAVTKLKFKSLYGTAQIGDKKCILMKPQTYMNNSGEAVRDAAAFYKIPAERIIVVSDDISLDVGKLRIKRKGSDGGHNGLKSIIYQLQSDNFSRIKMGVGKKPHPEYDLAAWVLSRFKNDEVEPLKSAAKNACDAIKLIVGEKIDMAMNKFNS
ncbi:MAG: aminoacyl-tRNA hydrolase [Clostridia bacterium]|nr:aminoacyl-tRNA hydrolase [Clostridia bacterium]MBQ9958235.1 aminoacyl-tRNA hydrolase [Clostridia bacterium]